MNNLGWFLAIALVACGKSSAPDKAPDRSAVATPKAVTPAPSAPATSKPQARDDGAKQLLARGTSCELRQGTLPLDCADYKAVGEYAFQNQGSDAVAETCASFLSDADLKKRLLAAACLEHLNARGKTPQLGAALDAIEHESDDTVREQIAWGIKDAEAVTAKLDDRVLALVNKLAADPKHEHAAGYLFWTFFPQYMMGSGPKPPAAAQALAIESLTRDETGMQRTAFDSIKMLDDKPAVCAALGKAIRADAKRWVDAAGALADLKDACIGEVPRVVDLTLDQLKAGDAQMALLLKLDRVFELDAATRKKIATSLKAARGKAREWERKSVDEAAASFSKPRLGSTK